MYTTYVISRSISLICGFVLPLFTHSIQENWYVASSFNNPVILFYRTLCYCLLGCLKQLKILRLDPMDDIGSVTYSPFYSGCLSQLNTNIRMCVLWRPQLEVVRPPFNRMIPVGYSQVVPGQPTHYFHQAPNCPKRSYFSPSSASSIDTPGAITGHVMSLN